MTPQEIKDALNKIMKIQEALNMAEMSLHLICNDIENVKTIIDKSDRAIMAMCTHKYEDGSSAVKAGICFDECEICGDEW